LGDAWGLRTGALPPVTDTGRRLVADAMAAVVGLAVGLRKCTK
jgi:hypothetical protein